MSRSIDVDTKTFIRFWLVILGFVVLGFFLYKAQTGILIILAAVFFAIALTPLAHKIDNIDKRKERRGLASGLAVTIVVLALVALVAFVGPVIVSETSKFLSAVPDQIGSLMQDDRIDRLGSAVGIPDLKDQIMTSVKDTTQSMINGLSNFAVSSLGTIGNAVTAIIFIIVLTILFMLQGKRLMDAFWQAVSGRNEKRGRAWEYAINRCAEVIAKYVSGQLLVAIIDGIVVGITTFVLSLIFRFSAGLAIPMGLIAAFCYLIPMFGPIITAVLVTLLLLPSSLWAALVFLVFYAVFEQIENNVISPRIQGKGLNLPPVVILMAIVLGTYSAGFVGCIVAIPIAGCIKVFIEEYPKLAGKEED